MLFINNTCISLLLVIALFKLSLTTADYPGVIELVGYSNRRARTHYIPTDNYDTSQAAPYTKMQADIETVKQNIEKYNKLLTLDTQSLPDSQKDMLERIVERVARLKESLDIHENYAKAQEFTSQIASVDYSTEIAQQPVEADTEPTLLLDETTLLQLKTTMDELGTAKLMVTAQPATYTELEELIQSDDTSINVSTESEQVPSTTFDYMADATDTDDQMVAARSNNKISAITAIDEAGTTPELSTQSASQRTLTTSGKLKTRVTKRPSTTATKPVDPTILGSNANNTPVKRIQTPNPTVFNAQKPPTKQKLATSQPQQSQQYFKPQQIKQTVQNKLTSQTTVDKMSSVTPITVSETVNQRISNADSSSPISFSMPTASSPQPLNGYNSGLTITPSNYNSNIATSNINYNNANDLIYDANVNASAIIDSLNHAREEYLQQKLNGVNINNHKDKVCFTANK